MTDKTKPHIRFQRANFVVRDLDKALTLYRDVLGFDVAFIKDSQKTSYSYPVFEIPNSATLRFAVLSTPESPRCMALTEVTGTDDIGPAPTPRRGAIVLDVPDVDGVVAGAKKVGATVYPEGELKTQDGRLGREVGIVDFDGNLVVIYTITAHPDE